MLCSFVLAINKGSDGHCSMTLKLSLPVSFLEVWNDFKIYESGTLKKVSITARDAETSYRLGLLQAEEKKDYQISCGLWP